MKRQTSGASALSWHEAFLVACWRLLHDSAVLCVGASFTINAAAAARLEAAEIRRSRAGALVERLKARMPGMTA